MKKIKVFALLATLFVGIFSNLFTPVVSAEGTSDNATVTIHKLQGQTGPIVNTGKELSGLTASDFLDGITYNVYDVTDEYHAKYNEVYTPTTAKAAADVARKYVQGTAGHKPSVVSSVKPLATKVTANGGAATFNLPKKSGESGESGGKDAVYVFVEQPKTVIRAAAENLVLRFPVYQLNGDGTYTDIELTNIHLYPKNTTETITPVKEITTPNPDAAERNNYNVGEKIGFKLSTKIPANIGIKEVDGKTPYYNTFDLIDTHDKTLTFNPAGYELKVAGTSIVLTESKENAPADYTIEVGEHHETFKVKLTQAGINKLDEQGGKTLEFTYTMKLNEPAKIDEEPIVNFVNVEYGRKITDSNGVETFSDVEQGVSNITEVYTGGYRFIKTDFSTNKPLAGAEFVVRNADAPDAKYLKIDAKTKEISWVDTYEEAFKFKTEDDGIVDITGLKYGTYYLEETIAPDDYVKLSERIEFTVEFESYLSLSRKTYEFVPLSLPDESDSDTPTEFKEHNVPNTPKGFLPQTGGAGIILFVALGAAMVGLAGVYFTSRRKDA